MQCVAWAQARAHTSMMYEDRLEAAERRRLEGNDLFAAGITREALSKYTMGLSHMNEDFLMQLEGLHLDRANAVRLPILLNMAASHLRLQEYTAAIGCCSQASRLTTWPCVQGATGRVREGLGSWREKWRKDEGSTSCSALYQIQGLVDAGC